MNPPPPGGRIETTKNRRHVCRKEFYELEGWQGRHAVPQPSRYLENAIEKSCVAIII
jgi:hypothetical protein